MASKRNYTMYTGDLRRPTKAYRNPGDTYDLLFELSKMKSRRGEQLPDPSPQPKARTPSPVRGGSPPNKQTKGRKPASAVKAAANMNHTDKRPPLSPVPADSSAPHSLRSVERTETTIQHDAAVLTPEARSRATLSYHENNLYVFGGCGPMNVYTGSRFRNDVLRYSIVDEQWSRVACRGTFPKPRAHHSAVVKDSKLVIYGGVDEEGNLFNDMYALSLREPHQWKKVSIRMPSAQSSCVTSDGNIPSAAGTSLSGGPVPPRLCGHAATLHAQRNSMLIHGGRTPDQGPSPALFEFRFQSQQWTKVGGNTFVPTSNTSAVGPLLHNHSATVYNNLLYLYGGSTYHHGDHNRPNDLIFTYDFDEMIWRTIETRQYPQLDIFCHAFFVKTVLASTTSTPTLFALSSRQSTSAVLRTPNSTASQWRMVACTPAKERPEGDELGFPEPRAFCASIVHGSRVFLFGGERVQGEGTGAGEPVGQSDFWVYNLTQEEWFFIPPAPINSVPQPAVHDGNESEEQTFEGSAPSEQPPRQSPELQSGMEGEEMNRSVSRTRARLDPTKRVTYKMSSTFNKDYEMQEGSADGRVPLWKRSNLPQAPPEEPNYNKYYGFAEPPHQLKKTAPLHPETFNEPQANEQLQMLKQILQMQKEHPLLKQKKTVAGFVPITVDAVADKFAVTTPEMLKSLIEHTPPQSILHSLLNEKYKFDKEKHALVEKAKVPPEEIGRYEALMDRVINSYITKTHSLLSGERIPVLPYVREPSISEAESLVRKELISRLEASFTMDKNRTEDSIPLLPPEPDIKLALPSLHPMVSVSEKDEKHEDTPIYSYKESAKDKPRTSLPDVTEAEPPRKGSFAE